VKFKFIEFEEDIREKFSIDVRVKYGWFKDPTTGEQRRIWRG